MARRSTAKGSRPAAGREPLSAYEKRIADYLARHPGATRQEARGHRPPAGRTEHAARMEKERASGGLTTYQRAAIKRFATRQAKRADRNRDPDRLTREMREWTEQKGWHRFEQLRETVKRKSREPRVRYRVRRRRGKDGGARVLDIDTAGAVARRDMMDDLVEDFDVPDVEWLYYH